MRGKIERRDERKAVCLLPVKKMRKMLVMGKNKSRSRGVDNQLFRLDRRLLLGHELAEFTFPNLKMRSLDRSQSAQKYFTPCLLETLRVASTSPRKHAVVELVRSRNERILIEQIAKLCMLYMTTIDDTTTLGCWRSK